MYEDCERDFTVELDSNKSLRKLSANGGVLIEGTLGKLLHIIFVEPEILEVKGKSGVLRLNIRKSEISTINEQLEKTSEVKSQ